MKTLQGSMGNLRSRELSITSAPDHSCSDLKHRTHSREKRTSNKISEFALRASGLRPCMHLITIYFMMLFPNPLPVQSDFRSEGIYIYTALYSCYYSFQFPLLCSRTCHGFPHLLECSIMCDSSRLNMNTICRRLFFPVLFS